MFELDKKLAEDSFFICDLKLCRVLLMNNANYPWLILVPREQGLIELIDLSFEKQREILHEINLVAQILQKKFSPYKLNIANLGNVVRQLHIHVIARFEDDAAFPRPVWGEAVENYKNDDAQKLILQIRQMLDQMLEDKDPANQIICLDRLQKQVLYKSIHRGCKETDFLIGEFAKAKIETFDEEKLQLFKKLIEEDDLLIYDWILDKETVPVRYITLVEELRKFHKI